MTTEAQVEQIERLLASLPVVPTTMAGCNLRFLPSFKTAGSNENFNGLLRQYVPKKRRIANITDEEIKMIENRLNNRSRKRFGFKTPAEVFHHSLSRIALRA